MSADLPATAAAAPKTTIRNSAERPLGVEDYHAAAAFTHAFDGLTIVLSERRYVFLAWY